MLKYSTLPILFFFCSCLNLKKPVALNQCYKIMGSLLCKALWPLIAYKWGTKCAWLTFMSHYCWRAMNELSPRSTLSFATEMNQEMKDWLQFSLSCMQVVACLYSASWGQRLGTSFHRLSLREHWKLLFSWALSFSFPNRELKPCAILLLPVQLRLGDLFPC